MSSTYPSTSTGPSPPPPSGPSAAAPSDSQHQLHSEDRLRRSWRSVESGIVMVVQKAEKVVSDPTKPNLKELDESVLAFLRTRVEWSRLLTYLEAKLEGKASETEVLQQYHRTQARLGASRRKRTREEQEVVDAASQPLEQVPDSFE